MFFNSLPLSKIKFPKYANINMNLSILEKLKEVSESDSSNLTAEILSKYGNVNN